MMQRTPDPVGQPITLESCINEYWETVELTGSADSDIAQLMLVLARNLAAREGLTDDEFAQRLE
jgi:hypothetical protein